jgi:hypothetical protein
VSVVNISGRSVSIRTVSLFMKSSSFFLYSYSASFSTTSLVSLNVSSTIVVVACGVTFLVATFFLDSFSIVSFSFSSAADVASFLAISLSV